MFITSLPHLAKRARCKLGVALALWGPDRVARACFCIHLPCEAEHSDGSAIVPGRILSLDSAGHTQYVLHPEQMPEPEMV